MSFDLSEKERQARARADLRIGLPLVFKHGDSRSVVASVETISTERLKAMLRLGPTSLAITARRAETLKARVYDGDLARISIGSGVTCDWLRSMADPSSDLAEPMKGPFQELRDGDSAVHRGGIALAKAAHLLPSVVVAELPINVELSPEISELNLEDLEGLILAAPQLKAIASARVPVENAGDCRLHVFRPADGGEEHYALEIGTPSRTESIPVRLHSACFTGDILGSLKCDCGPQLRGALSQMGIQGSGILLYLNQEGRGIGLANKMRAYALQDQGFDTVEANHRLGFEDDERDFRIGAAILKDLGFERVRLMTNNPKKVDMLEAHGIAVVERVPLHSEKTPFNRQYLETKSKKSGHLL